MIHRLFNARRGPLLGPILQHPDDIDALRTLFLQSGLADCLRLISPTLLSFNDQGEFEQVCVCLFTMRRLSNILVPLWYLSISGQMTLRRVVRSIFSPLIL